MHTYVHCSPVYNSKDLESTQMPISDRLDKENMVHIHHGILWSHNKEQNDAPCSNMDVAGDRYPKKTNTESENHMFLLLSGS